MSREPDVWIVTGSENHPDRERRFGGVFLSEDKAKEATKKLNEDPWNNRGDGGKMFEYSYQEGYLNQITNEFI